MSTSTSQRESAVAGKQAMSGEDLGTRAMAQALAALYAAGATLALLTVALPHSHKANDLALLLIVGNAYAVGALLFWRASTLSKRVLPVALLWGTTLITLVAYFSGQTPSPLVFFYVWVFLYASYVLTENETAVQMAYAGLAYGALLALREPSGGVAEWWLVGMGTLAVTALLIRSLRGRVESLIGRLYESAHTDPLTGLTNRTGFRELLDLELERARRAACEVTLLIGNLDRFKEVNDRAGREAGDAALRRVAQVLHEDKRQLDGLARVGGEEFTLVLPDTGGAEGLIVAERLRERVAEELAQDTVPVTISFGVASFPAHGHTASSLVRAGEEALYAAKLAGADRCVLHSSALREELVAGGRGRRDIAGERFLAVVLDLAEAVDLRFSGSARHSETVGRYAAMIAHELGLSEERVERVRIAGMLHDVGKVGVPDSILGKPGKLTDEEFETIKRHPELGEQILEHDTLADVREWVGRHHERPDGRGYPQGLRGEQIPLEAQILAVADAYEAMTADRSYRSAIGHDAARAELERCSGTQFETRIVGALLAAIDRRAERSRAVSTPPGRGAALGASR